MCKFSKTITVVLLLIAACSSIVNAEMDFEFVKPSNGDTVYCGDSLTIQIRNKGGDEVGGLFWIKTYISGIGSKKYSFPYPQGGYDFKADSIFKFYLPDSITPSTYKLDIGFFAGYTLPEERIISLVIMKKQTNTQKRASPRHSSLVPAHGSRVVLFERRNCLSGIRISNGSNQIFDLRGKFIEGSGLEKLAINNRKQ